MNTNTEAADSPVGSGLYGKLVGIVKQQEQVQLISEALSLLGVIKFEVLDGQAGMERLVNWRDTVTAYFFGDMEQEMVERYLDAVQNGLIVFAATVEHQTADQAGMTARELGATDVAHFGNAVVTNY
jgi:precorrin-6B methylase 2